MPDLARLLAALDAFDWPAWHAKLRSGLTPITRDIVLEAGQRVSSEFNLDDPFTDRALTEYIGERILQLEAFTRENVTDLIRRVLDEQGGARSTVELGSLIRDEVRTHVAGYQRWRADRIARTETAIATNTGTVLGAKQSGMSRVLVSDGDDDEPCASANGSIWTLEEALANPLAHPNAVMAGTDVMPLGRLEGAYRAVWRGPVVSLTTATGLRLTCGPNHPILTGRGWIRASELHEGDDVISSTGLNQPGDGVADVDFNDVPSRVEQIFDALALIGSYSRVVAAPVHLHGDGRFCEGKVEVVTPNGLLSNEDQTALLQQARKSVLVDAGSKHETFAGVCSGGARGGRIGAIPAGSVGGGGIGGVRASASDRYAAFSESMSNDRIADAALASELKCALAVPVLIDQIVEIRNHESFVGHAFDLHTSSRAYFAGGILVHNCTRSFSPLPD